MCACDVDEYIFLFLLSYNFVLLTFYRDLGENRAHSHPILFSPQTPSPAPEVPYFLAYRTSTYVPPSILSYNVTLTYSIYIYHVCGLTVLWLKGIFLFLFLTVVWLDFRRTIQIRCHCKSTIPLSSSCCTYKCNATAQRRPSWSFPLLLLFHLKTVYCTKMYIHCTMYNVHCMYNIQC